MAYLDDVGQKLKGEAQKVKGKVQQNNGRPLTGAMEELKGKTNQTLADIKLRSRDSRTM